MGAFYCIERKPRFWEEMTSHGGPNLRKAGLGRHVQGGHATRLRYSLLIPRLPSGLQGHTVRLSSHSALHAGTGSKVFQKTRRVREVRAAWVRGQQGLEEAPG